MSKIFFISDTHFGDKNIIRYENRPFKTIEQMDYEIVENWNGAVSRDDIVFHLGDVSFYDKEKTKEIISQLNGTKILVKGNHDDKNNQWFLDVGFDEVSNYPIIYNEWFILQHEPPTYYNSTMPYFYLYGHCHSTEMYRSFTKQSSCVCLERWAYTPVELSRIIELVKA